MHSVACSHAHCACLQVKDSNSPALLYEVLFPHLAGVTLGEVLADGENHPQPTPVDWQTPQRAGVNFYRVLPAVVSCNALIDVCVSADLCFVLNFIPCPSLGFLSTTHVAVALRDDTLRRLHPGPVQAACTGHTRSLSFRLRVRPSRAVSPPLHLPCCFTLILTVHTGPPCPRPSLIRIAGW